MSRNNANKNSRTIGGRFFVCFEAFRLITTCHEIILYLKRNIVNHSAEPPWPPPWAPETFSPTKFTIIYRIVDVRGAVKTGVLETELKHFLKQKRLGFPALPFTKFTSDRSCPD
jgi:hypothetical protein